MIELLCFLLSSLKDSHSEGIQVPLALFSSSLVSWQSSLPTYISTDPSSWLLVSVTEQLFSKENTVVYCRNSTAISVP
jgi:hypothetical protein